MNRRGGNSTDDVEEQKTQVPKPPLDIVAKDPQEQHVADEVKKPGMEKHRQEQWKNRSREGNLVLTGGALLESESIGGIHCLAHRFLPFDPTDEDGGAKGRFICTGVRPKCMDRMEAAGIKLPASIFRERVMMAN